MVRPTLMNRRTSWFSATPALSFAHSGSKLKSGDQNELAKVRGTDMVGGSMTSECVSQSCVCNCILTLVLQVTVPQRVTQVLAVSLEQGPDRVLRFQDGSRQLQGLTLPLTGRRLSLPSLRKGKVLVSKCEPTWAVKRSCLALLTKD